MHFPHQCLIFLMVAKKHTHWVHFKGKIGKFHDRSQNVHDYWPISHVPWLFHDHFHFPDFQSLWDLSIRFLNTPHLKWQGRIAFLYWFTSMSPEKKDNRLEFLFISYIWNDPLYGKLANYLQALKFLRQNRLLKLLQRCPVTYVILVMGTAPNLKNQWHIAAT